MTAEAANSGILQIVNRMSPGGIETMALDLMDDVDLGGRIVSLAGRMDELTSAWPALQSVSDKIVCVGQGEINHLAVLRDIVRQIRQQKPKAVIAHHIGPLLHGGIAARLAGIRRVIHIEHDAWHYVNAKHRAIAKFCELIVRPERVAVSDEVACRVREFLPSASFTIIPPGIDVDRHRPRCRSAARASLGLGLDAGIEIIGSVGRLAEVKGHHHLIAALPRLSRSAHIILVGDGPERGALERQANEIGVADRVHFLGMRSDPEFVVPAFDVFCLPSLAEGLPRALLEAQACAVPVVASNVGGVARALPAGSGRLVPPADPDALASAIREVLTADFDPDAIRARIVERYSLSATKRALLEMVEADTL